MSVDPVEQANQELSGLFANRYARTTPEQAVKPAANIPKLTPKQLKEKEDEFRKDGENIRYKRQVERMVAQCLPKWDAMDKAAQDSLAQSVLRPMELKLFVANREKSWLSMETIFEAMLAAEFGDR